MDPSVVFGSDHSTNYATTIAHDSFHELSSLTRVESATNYLSDF